MEFKQYRKRVLSYAGATNAQGKDGLMDQAVLGLCAQAGEVAHTLYQHRYGGMYLHHRHLQEQLGEMLGCITLLAAQCDSTLDSIAKRHLTTLSQRYPYGPAEEATAPADEAEVV